VFLRASAVAAGAAALPTGAAFAAESPAHPTGSLSRASRVFLDRGLFIGAWVTTPVTKRYYPTVQEWRQSGFDTATFYEKPYFNKPLFDALPVRTQWALAVYPAGGIGGKPAPGRSILSTEQQAHVDSLFTLCFGDEELYSTQLVDWLAAWFALTHKQHPRVLVHNNQYAAEWSQAELRSYVRTAKPDLLTYDAYYFGSPDPYKGGGRPDVYDALNAYRVVALAGHDGTGRSPIAFGHYTEGFKGGPGYTYVPSESELNLDYFAAWTMGAKWTNLFRWEQDSSVFLFYDKDGAHTPQFRQLGRIARQGRRLSPFLVRLSSTDVRIVPGRHRNSAGDITPNTRPRRVDVWDAFASPYVQSIKAGADGDLLIGYFQRLPGLDAASAAHELPPVAAAQFTAPYVKAFMVLNGGIAPNTAGTADSTDGSGRATRQRVTVALHRLGRPNRLLRVDRGTGRLEPVVLHHGPGGTDHFAVDLDGGEADLFFLTTGPSYDRPPALTAGAAVRAVEPGQEFTVRATAANMTAAQPIPDLQARLTAPPGWSIQPDGSIRLGDLHPGRSNDVSWRVTAPADADAGDFTLIAETTYRYGPHTTVRGGARVLAGVHIPYLAISDGSTNTGITDDADPTAGDLDGDGNSYSAQALAAAGLTPGGPLTAGGITFTWPHFSPDNVIADGQAFSIHRSGTVLGVLGACTYGAASGTGTIVYGDGTSHQFELAFPDWYGTPPAGTTVAVTLPYRNSPTGPDQNPVNLYVASIDLDPSKTVQTLILPHVSDGLASGIAAMHVFAIAVS